jgi:hypothetical protein
VSIQAIITEAPAGVKFDRVRIGRPAERKYFHTVETDAVIRHAYALWIQDGDRKALTRARQTLGWPKHIVTRRGAELGLSRVKEADWTLAEVAILEANCQYGHDRIRKCLADAGFRRSRTAILLKRRRMGLTRAYDGYSATQLGKLFGAGVHGITQFIDRGWLAAEKRGTARSERQGGDTWYISRAAVLDFLFAHPEEWDLRKVEKWWFLELVTDGKICR